MSIYDDHQLSDDGLRCPECGRVDCECVDWETERGAVAEAVREAVAEDAG